MSARTISRAWTSSPAIRTRTSTRSRRCSRAGGSIPDAVVVLTGSLNRNVREFCRLHADELDLADAARIDPAQITRLIVVETARPGAARRARASRAATRGSRSSLFDHHRRAAPTGSPAETAVLSETARSRRRWWGSWPSARSPSTRARGDRVRARDPRGHRLADLPERDLRDAEALAWCLRHGARQDMVAQYLHSPLGADGARAPRGARRRARGARASAGFDVLVTAVDWPDYVDGISNLAHKLVDLTDARGLVCLVEMEERVVCVVRSRVRRARRRRDRGRARRRRAPAGGVRDLPRAAGRGARAGRRGASRGRAGAAHAPRDHVPAGALRRSRRHGRARDGRLPAPPPERHPRRRRGAARGRRDARGPRQGDRPRPRARARQERHDRGRGDVRRADAARRAAAARRRSADAGRVAVVARRRGRGRRHPQRHPARVRRARAGADETGRRPARALLALPGLGPVFEAVQARRERLRRRVPRRRRRARHPHGRAELRRRHRRRGRRDRVRPGACRRARRARDARTRSSARRS